MSRCWPVKRWGRGRLARYSRNFSSGLCPTSTLGRSAPVPSGGSVIVTGCSVIQESASDGNGPGAPPAGRGSRGIAQSVTREAVEQPVEGGLPLLGRIVGAGGDFLPDSLDELGSDSLVSVAC